MAGRSATKSKQAGAIRVGIGGWVFEPWRGVFYPDDLSQKRELEFASRALTSIEINGTFYSTFKPATWERWREETPDDFVFAVKGSRYCTNRRVLADAGSSIERFVDQGLALLGPKLGPINWQLAETKVFSADDIDAFLRLLPQSRNGVRLRHAIEVRHPSFATSTFTKLARKHGVAVVRARGSDFPDIDERTADFAYTRLMGSREEIEQGFPPREIGRIAKDLRAAAATGDVFAYFISGAKVRNPAAAQALISALTDK